MKVLLWMAAIAVIMPATTSIAAGEDRVENDRLFQWMLGSYVGLQMTDAYLTHRGLQAGAVEGNPVLGSGGSVLTAKILMVPFTSWGLARLHRTRPKLARGLAIGLNAVYLGVAVNNRHVIEDLE